MGPLGWATNRQFSGVIFMDIALRLGPAMQGLGYDIASRPACGLARGDQGTTTWCPAHAAADTTVASSTPRHSAATSLKAPN
jgi:hypothetical protein